MRTPLALLAAAAVLAPALARAQPMDPYGSDPAPDPGGVKPPPPVGDPPADPPPGVTGDRDPEIDEAVAASLVVRAKQLMSIEEWADAKQLLTEALVRSPDGATAVEANQLMEQVNLKLGIAPKVDTTPVDPYADDQVGIGDPINPEVPQPEQPYAYPQPARNGGKKFLLHATTIGAVIGGFLGDAATADVQPIEVDGDPINTEDSGGVIAGVLLGGLGGLAIGAGFRHSPWMTTDDITVIDSFAAMGMVGSLSLAGVMHPVESEGYSVNAVIGTAAGAVTGYVVAKRRDLSKRRMGRVDLWAATGALVPWAIFAAAKGNANGAKAAGFFSMAGMIGGAWLGFRLTRHWDDKRTTSATVDAPMALFQRHSDGIWTLGAPAIAPQPGGATATVLGAAW
jgi:hypothetical protein